MSDELKDCPFCGKSVKFSGDYYDGELASIDCDCSMYVQRYKAENTAKENEELLHDFDGLIARWNSRPIEDALRAEVSRLARELAEMREAARWVPVGERLPDRAKRVMVYTVEFAQHTAWLDWVNRDGEPLFVYYEVPGKVAYLNSVTHWRPLPAAPESAE